MHELCNELILPELQSFMSEKLKEFNYAEIAWTNGMKALFEIKSVIKRGELEDFEIVEEIINVLKDII